jgi:hypothetical protein
VIPLSALRPFGSVIVVLVPASGVNVRPPSVERIAYA